MLRNTITGVVWLAGCSDASGPPGLTMSPVSATNGQTAMIGTALPRPLQVKVTSDGGAVGSGVHVTWRASAGTIVPAAGVTDGEGMASAVWTLGTEPGPMTATSTIAGAQGSPVSFQAIATPPRVTATVADSGTIQSGVVGTALGAPLRIQVLFGGVPKAGVPVHWSTGYGSLQPVDDTTDADGFSETRWTLGTVARFVTAGATVSGVTGGPLGFVAHALAAPAVAIQPVGGSGQSFPANRQPDDSLVAQVFDRYGNAVPDQAVTWTVERGPVEFSLRGGATDAAGRSVSTIAPSGGTGGALVRAAVPGVAAADFTLSVEPKAFEVLLSSTNGNAFTSLQNHSTRPAVDTIPAGRTVVWTLEFDYDLHGVASVGTPSFQGKDFPYYGWPTVSLRFDTPGTYHYVDPYHPSATGILVVQ